MTAIKKKTKKIVTSKKPKSTSALTKKNPAASAPKEKVEYIDDFESVCPISVGFTSRLRRGNSGVFSVTFPLVENIVENAGFDDYYGTWRGVYDFQKGLLVSTSSPPDLYRAGAAVFYPHGPRVIDKHDGAKTYWKWHGSLELDDINDEAWAMRVADYLSDAQFAEWAHAVLERLREAAFKQTKEEKRKP